MRGCEDGRRVGEIGFWGEEIGDDWEKGFLGEGAGDLWDEDF